MKNSNWSWGLFWTAWAHMFWGYEKPAQKSQAQVFYSLWDVFYFLLFIVLFLVHSARSITLIIFIWRRASYWIAREIEIFSIFAWLVTTSAPKQNLRLLVFCSTICWLWCSINIYETFGKENCSFLVESCCCSLLRKRSKFEDVAFRRSMSLDHQTLLRGKH